MPVWMEYQFHHLTKKESDCSEDNCVTSLNSHQENKNLLKLYWWQKTCSRQFSLFQSKDRGCLMLYRLWSPFMYNGLNFFTTFTILIKAYGVNCKTYWWVILRFRFFNVILNDIFLLLEQNPEVPVSLWLCVKTSSDQKSKMRPVESCSYLLLMVCNVLKTCQFTPMWLDKAMYVCPKDTLLF